MLGNLEVVERKYILKFSEITMLSMDQGGGGGAPKPNRASKKGKKSWRKNVDMKVGHLLHFTLGSCINVMIQAVDAALEEARFEERVGGSFADRANDQIFRHFLHFILKSQP